MADNGFVLAFEVLLRFVGAFYAMTAPFVLRTAALSHFLDGALVALGGRSSPAQRRAERARTMILTSQVIVIGIGGIWLMALSTVATWFFVVSALGYGVYLYWIAPRYLDPHDEPDEPGRRQARNAFFVYVVATALVVAGHSGGLLRAGDDVGWPASLLAAGLSFALIAYAGYLFAPKRPIASHEPFDEDWSDAPAYDDIDYERITADRAVLRPSWDQGALFDAEDGRPVTRIAGVELTHEDHEFMSAWTWRFHEVADPDDPMRCAMRADADLEGFEAHGRSIFESIRERAGDRIAFEPRAAPCEARIVPSAIKVMADYECYALWHDGGDEVGNIWPDQAGLSWSLARDLEAWAIRYDGAVDLDDPGAGSPWTSDEFDTFDREGEALAARVAQEFARTGRADVPVRYVPAGRDAE
jgi:hypothetical protein